MTSTRRTTGYDLVRRTLTPAGYAAKQKWMMEEAYAFSLT